MGVDNHSTVTGGIASGASIFVSGGGNVAAPAAFLKKTILVR